MWAGIRAGLRRRNSLHSVRSASTAAIVGNKKGGGRFYFLDLELEDTVLRRRVVLDLVPSSNPARAHVAALLDPRAGAYSVSFRGAVMDRSNNGGLELRLLEGEALPVGVSPRIPPPNATLSAAELALVSVGRTADGVADTALRIAWGAESHRGRVPVGVIADGTDFLLGSADGAKDPATAGGQLRVLDCGPVSRTAVRPGEQSEGISGAGLGTNGYSMYE